MKCQTRSLVLFLIMVTVYVNTSTAQSALNGFLNLPFGIKMETAKKLLLQKPGTKYIRQSDRTNFYFTGFSIGAYKADTCILVESMPDGKFESCNLVFRSQADMFKEIHELFRAQYGDPIKIYLDGDDILYRWEFPVKGSKYKNTITLQSASAADCVTLRYSGMGTLCPGWLQQYSHKTKNNAEDF